MATNLTYQKIYDFIFVEEDAWRLSFLEKGLGLCALLKFCSFLPFSEAPSILSIPLILLGCVFSVLLIVGKYCRLSAFVLACIYLSFYLQFPFDHLDLSFNSHHVQLLTISLFLISLLPNLQTLRLLVFVVYGSAILLKLNPYYVSGIQLQQIFMAYYWGSDPLPTISEWIFKFLAVLSIASEVLIFVGLAVKKWRNQAIFFAIPFHITLFLLLPVSIFSLLMIVLVVGLFKKMRPKDYVLSLLQNKIDNI